MNQVLRRSGLLAVALSAALVMSLGDAEARRGGGFGSRGAKTWSAPPTTRTAPTTAAPMQRTQTQPGVQQRAPGAQAAQAGQQRRFGGFGAGLMGGLLGAGLIGMLMGGGFFSGMAGLAGFLGLILQLALVGGLVWLAVRFFRSRQQPAAAGQAGAAHFRAARQPQGNDGFRLGPAGAGAPAMGARPASAQPRYAPPSGQAGSDGVGLQQQDYEAFEQRLAEVQTAFGRGDAGALRRICTPEAAAYLEEELAGNESRGVVNSVSDVRLQQGDLAEAWREGATDYATVAMRYTMIDVTRERATGRVVDGDAGRPVEVTEVWTFRRDNRGPWVLSAIQDVN